MILSYSPFPSLSSSLSVPPILSPSLCRSPPISLSLSLSISPYLFLPLSVSSPPIPFFPSQESFEKLNKQLEKVLRLTESSAPPRPFLRGMALLEDHLNAALANKDARKKMSSSNAKALNYLKQKLKKNIKAHEAAMEQFRASPASEDEEEDEDDEDEEEEEEEEEEESVEDPLDRRGGEEEEEEGEGWEKQRGKKDRLVEKQFQRDHSEIKWEEVNAKLREVIAARGRKGTDRAEQVEQLTYLAKVAKTPAQKLEVLVHVVSAQFDVSQSLHAHVPVPVWRKCVENLMAMLDLLAAHANLVLEEPTEASVSAAADEEEGETSKGADHEGPIRVWGSVVAFVERMDDELFKSLQVRGEERMDSHLFEEPADAKRMCTPLPICLLPLVPVTVALDIPSQGLAGCRGHCGLDSVAPSAVEAPFLYALSASHHPMPLLLPSLPPVISPSPPPPWQCTDPYTKDYVDRLRDEPVLLALAEGAQAYAERAGDMRGAARMALRRCEHIYYKPEVGKCERRAMSRVVLSLPCGGRGKDPSPDRGASCQIREAGWGRRLASCNAPCSASWRRTPCQGRGGRRVLCLRAMPVPPCRACASVPCQCLRAMPVPPCCTCECLHVCVCVCVCVCECVVSVGSCLGACRACTLL